MKKNICIGVSGGIAAYKTCEIVSKLIKLGFNVKVCMTKNATEFVSPLTFETLSKNKVCLGCFEKKEEYDIEHISLAKWASVFCIVPASADIIAKLAEGICDDMLTTSFCASKAKKIVCPAMNTNMYLSPTNQRNMDTLKNDGITIVDSDVGLLACGDVGVGRLAEVDVIVNEILKQFEGKLDLLNKNILVTCGATIEDIDGVRFISNYSSGKMGKCIIEEALNRGANVTAIVGAVSVEIPKEAKIINVKSTDDMYKACIDNFDNNDIFIMSAAPADYRPKQKFDQKIKSENLVIEFEKNVDIAKTIGLKKGNKILVCFAAETNDLLKNAQEKLINKNVDFIVANDVTKKGAGFKVDTNIATIIEKNGEITKLDIMLKEELAKIILDKVKKYDI